MALQHLYKPDHSRQLKKSDLMKKTLIAFSSLFLLTSCREHSRDFDATGTFEAVETIISAEATGMLVQFNAEEGILLQAGEITGFIDSTQLVLKKKQLVSQVRSVLSRKPDVKAQVAALQEQLRQAGHEQQRITRLVQAEAATQKQLDDATAQVAILEKQIKALKSSLGITSSSLYEETGPLQAQLEQVQDQLNKCRLVNPVTGTVLTQYTRQHEMVVAGKPLYKIADLSTIQLRAYITGNQYASLKLNQQVKVRTDDGQGGYKAYTGTVIWISEKAEFTPKTIQTRDERANLVYAIKIRVKNDGFLKIGMYGEMNL